MEHCTAVSIVSPHGKWTEYVRKTEKEGGRYHDKKAGRNVYGPVTSVLETSSPAKDSVSREVLIVLS